MDGCYCCCLFLIIVLGKICLFSPLPALTTFKVYRGGSVEIVILYSSMHDPQSVFSSSDAQAGKLRKQWEGWIRREGDGTHWKRAGVPYTTLHSLTQGSFSYTSVQDVSTQVYNSLTTVWSAPTPGSCSLTSIPAWPYCIHMYSTVLSVQYSYKKRSLTSTEFLCARLNHTQPTNGSSPLLAPAIPASNSLKHKWKTCTS